MSIKSAVYEKLAYKIFYLPSIDCNLVSFLGAVLKHGRKKTNNENYKACKITFG